MVVPLLSIKINIAKGNKKKRNVSTKSNVISRVCKAVVIKDDEGFKAKINTNNEENSDILLIPFTTESYNIKGKEIIY